MRINRYLAAAGVASRRGSETLILEGRVSINGNVVENLATQVQNGDIVKVGRKTLQVQEPLTLAFHKPKGAICSTTDLKNRKTIYDYLPESFPRLFYVGRLDTDSEGLLILTNQGELSQKLTHPSHKVEKIYHVRLDREFDFEKIAKLTKGFRIEPGFARMDSVYHLQGPWLKVVLSQGLKRQIRLMFSRLGYKVKELKRVQIGGLKLGRLKPGEWRIIKKREIENSLGE